VSGGSIFGGFLALHWGELARHGYSVAAYEQYVSAPFSHILSTRNLRNRWLARSVLSLPRLLSPAYSRGDVLTDVLDAWLYEGKTMPELPAGPDLVLNATSLATGRQFRFRRDTLGEWQFGYANYGSRPVRLAYAVVASSAAPPVVPPVRLDPAPYAWPRETPRGDLWLADGGVYDNLGLEWFLGDGASPGCLIISEASGYLQPQWKNYRLSGLLGRVQSIEYEQTRAIRQRWLQDQFALKRRVESWLSRGEVTPLIADRLREFTSRGVIVSIDRIVSDLAWARRELSDWALPKDIASQVSRIRTDIDGFLPVEIELLSYHGYSLAHCYLSTFLPHLAVATPAWRLDLSPEQAAVYERGLAQSRRTLTLSRRLW
jgi:predicted acylesterase/phospholipase RssA